MVRQGSADHSVAMKTAARRSPADRDRAVARLRALTIGTSIASFAAVGGFGAMAALSYDGTTGGITTAAAVTTDNATTTTTGTTTTTTTTATPSTTSGTTSVQATAAPTATTGTAHAATGSS
jgi:hypothetical protein